MAALHECINVQSACSVSLENQLPVTQAPVGVGQRHFVAAFEKVKPSVSQTVSCSYKHSKLEELHFLMNFVEVVTSSFFSQQDRLMYEQMKHLSTKI